MIEGPQDIKIVAANECFWALPKTSLVSLARHWGIDIEQGSDLCSVAFSMVKAILGKTDEDTLKIVSKRMAYHTKQSAFFQEMRELDEAISLFDSCDRQLVEKEQQRVEGGVQEGNTFKSSYKKKAEGVRASADKEKEGTASAKNKSGKVASKAGVSSELRVPDSFTITHAEAKRLLPEGASVWRGLQRNTWHAHLHPFPRCSAQWSKMGGETPALSRVLRIVWQQHLDMRGLSASDCPVKGLFEG